MRYIKQISLEELYFPFIDTAVRTSNPIVYIFLINGKKYQLLNDTDKTRHGSGCVAHMHKKWHDFYNGESIKFD
jgi:hypothetical protein